MATKKKTRAKPAAKRRIPQLEMISGLQLLDWTIKHITEVRGHLTTLPQRPFTFKGLNDAILYCEVANIVLDECARMLRNAQKRVKQ